MDRRPHRRWRGPRRCEHRPAGTTAPPAGRGVEVSPRSANCSAPRRRRDRVKAAAEVLASAARPRRASRADDGRRRGPLRPALAVLASRPWHSQDGRLIEPLDLAMRSTPLLIRKVAAVVGRGENLPPGYREVITMADAADVIARALSETPSPDVARKAVLEVAVATSGLPHRQPRHGDRPRAASFRRRRPAPDHRSRCRRGDRRAARERRCASEPCVTCHPLQCARTTCVAIRPR